MAQHLDSQITNIRNEAARMLAVLSVPSVKDENYRYTSLKDLALDRLMTEAAAVAPARDLKLAAELDRNEDEAALIALSADARLSRLGQLPKGVFVGDLASVPADVAVKLQSLLKLPQVFERDLFATLAAAKFQNVAVVYVPRGVKVDASVRVLHVLEGEAVFHRTIILAEENAEVSVVEEYAGAGTGSSPVACGLVQVQACAGARVKLAQAQNWGSSVQFFLRQHLVADADATVEFVPVYSGGRKGQIRTEAVCQGKGSRVATRGAVRGHRDQHFDFWMTVTHPVPHTNSELEYWTVMGDRARAVFNGKIVIKPEAPHTEAYQKNRNMLLSREAEIDTIPKLEIAVDDVKCAHGASVSSVHPDQLYYLQSRGISKREAEEMIIRGFTAPVIAELPSEALRARVSQALERKSEVTL